MNALIILATIVRYAWRADVVRVAATAALEAVLRQAEHEHAEMIAEARGESVPAEVSR